MTEINIAVQVEKFDQSAVYKWLSESNKSGAVVLFIGKVRDMNFGSQVDALFLEHYPGMTEKSLYNIATQAAQRWNLERIQIVHRVGQLYTGDEIVLVGVSSVHRGDAYRANEFIMDYLKVQAPFWKKEKSSQGEHWVEERESDKHAAERW